MLQGVATEVAMMRSIDNYTSTVDNLMTHVRTTPADGMMIGLCV